MKRLNENALARRIARKEGGKVNLPIAQIKEVIKHTLDDLAKHDVIIVMTGLLERRVRNSLRSSTRTKRCR